MAATYSSLVGVQIGGKYEIRRVLGAGGMGVVCEAVHLDLGKRVAVKLIDKSMKESELIVARFRREARAAGQINSEHIVDVFDVGADQRVGLYMVMEYLTGEDLQSRLERDKRIDVKVAVMIAHQVASGLAKAHEVGVIHRDLKPANIYLTERDNGQLLVKVLDFGVSKLLDETPGNARITGSGAPIGTPLYMAPEQAEGKDDVDGRADIWSLGAVLYEALAGTPPFADRGSYHGTIVGILTSRPKLLFDVAPWVPHEITEVVDAMLVHDREARLASAAVVRQRLLQAFPNVLPDGTGKYTAVIVAPSATPVDTTGDTELFSASAMPELERPRRNERRNDAGTKRISSPDTSATSTGDATIQAPVDLASTGAALAYLGNITPSGPKTAPLPPVSSVPGSSGPLPPISSAPKVGGMVTPQPYSGPMRPVSSTSSGGVSIHAEPLPPNETVSASERDEVRAFRADRRRRMMFLTLFIVIIAVAMGGYLAGRSASRDSVVRPLPTPSASHVTPPPTKTVTPVVSAEVPTASVSVAPPTPAVTTAEPPRSPRKLKARPAATPKPDLSPTSEVVPPPTSIE